MTNEIFGHNYESSFMTHQIFSQKIETWLWEKKQNGYIGPQTLMAEMLDVRFQNGI